MKSQSVFAICLMLFAPFTLGTSYNLTGSLIDITSETSEVITPIGDSSTWLSGTLNVGADNASINLALSTRAWYSSILAPGASIEFDVFNLTLASGFGLEGIDRAGGDGEYVYIGSTETIYVPAQTSASTAVNSALVSQFAEPNPLSLEVTVSVDRINLSTTDKLTEYYYADETQSSTPTTYYTEEALAGIDSQFQVSFSYKNTLPNSTAAVETYLVSVSEVPLPGAALLFSCALGGLLVGAKNSRSINEKGAR